MPACWTTLRNPGTSWPLPPRFWCCWRRQWFCGTLWRILHSSPTDPVLLTPLKWNFKKPENLCILTDCTLQYIVFVVTSANQIFHTKTFIAFLFVYKSNYSWSTLLHLKIIQLSKYLQMIWTRKYFHIKIKCLLSIFWQILTT